MNRDELEGYVTRQVGYSQSDWDNLFQSIRHGAKFAYTYYTALIQEGFSAEQALLIVRAHGVIPKYPPTPQATPRDDEES